MLLKKSKNSWHFLNQGLTAVYYNQFKKAISHFNKAILLEPENIVFQLHKGMTLHKIKNFQNAIICYDNILLIDPKRVELTQYNGVPHLATRVVVEPAEAVIALRGAVDEMMHRLRLLEETGSRNIDSYNSKINTSERLAKLVIVVDEMADLMMLAPNDIEHALCRLAQLGRATGIHLIIATQRPSVDVITGLIKANFPSRISFAVASQTDSRTILDGPGADKLLGNGDMLFLSQDLPKPKRIQGAFVSDDEIEALVEHWKTNDSCKISDFLFFAILSYFFYTPININ
mgnify:CR=1 FL=1